MKLFLLTLIFSVLCFGASYSEKVEHIPTLQPDGYCNVLKRTIVYRDGEELSVDNHRYNLPPESDLSQFDSYVKDRCKGHWTPAIIKKFKEDKKKRDQLADRPPK